MKVIEHLFWRCDVEDEGWSMSNEHERLHQNTRLPRPCLMKRYSNYHLSPFMFVWIGVVTWPCHSGSHRTCERNLSAHLFHLNTSEWSSSKSPRSYRLLYTYTHNCVIRELGREGEGEGGGGPLSRFTSHSSHLLFFNSRIHFFCVRIITRFVFGIFLIRFSSLAPFLRANQTWWDHDATSSLYIAHASTRP